MIKYFVFAVTILTLNTTQAAIISAAGSNIDLGSGWRTATVSGDIDSDGFLGTDGFRYVTDNAGGNGANDVESSAPSYASLTLTDTNFRGNVGYALIDDPNSTPGATPTTLRSGTFNPGGGAVGGGEGEFLDFGDITFNRNSLTGETVRIGLMVDNLDNTIFNSHFLRLSTGGTNTDVATTAETNADNGTSDWYYFDITNFNNGDVISVFATRSDGNAAGTSLPATIGAFSFDSVPEVGTLSLLTFGVFLYILTFRPRRSLKVA